LFDCLLLIFKKGASNAQLIQNLQRNVQISERIASTFLNVDRANYCLDSTMGYLDGPQPIGFGATISAPHMHALAFKLMEPNLIEKNNNQNNNGEYVSVLDVGSGSGYFSVCLALYVQGYGNVVGIDHIPELVDWSIKNVQKDGKDYLFHNKNENNNNNNQCLPTSSSTTSSSNKSSKCPFPTLSLKVGDGYKGWSDNAPYDAIHVGAAVNDIPKILLNQLKPNGVLIIPVASKHGDWVQDYLKVTKLVDDNDNESYSHKKVTQVRYVPLTTPEKQLRLEDSL